MLTLKSQNIPHGKSLIIPADVIQVDVRKIPAAYYRHGWQSWSLAAWTPPAPMPVQKPDIFHPLQVDPAFAADPTPHGSWVGALEFKDGSVLLLGSLGLDAHVRLEGKLLHGHYTSGSGDWFVARGPEDQVFSKYAAELGKRFGKASGKSAPRVWCSWYSLYTEIDESILKAAFDGLDGHPFDVFQVDDGWQASVGDWLPNAKFPSGMAALADRIRRTGRKAGLWLAPLLAVESSALFRERRDWFLRDGRGNLVPAGFNWGQRLFALDATLPAVGEWLATLMRQVRTWGFDYIKLDFLYAGALPGKRHEDLPREQAYRRTLEQLRQAMGRDAFFLACGTPILPALGLADAIRIGPDVSDDWEKPRDAVLLSNFTTPGTRNAIRTSLHRLWLAPIVRIDPDVVYFASPENKLTEEQKSLLKDLALICAFKATSDLPQWLTLDERTRLDRFLRSRPKIVRTGRYRFSIAGRVVDYTQAAGIPAPARGMGRGWAAFLGWLGSQPPVLKILHRSDKAAMKKRRESLERP